jgi:hypothetical protein
MESIEPAAIIFLRTFQGRQQRSELADLPAPRERMGRALSFSISSPQLREGFPSPAIMMVLS